ncbi:TPA: phage antirepressor KilAC domain-containing protein [Escherichia coli]|uniref:phage antirepressor KilAC domain-containing protein n=1 Tax=Escherichia coli TaxID=562 RepID=UPI000DA44CB4|nr:phage antirepressor KilAC domain-containing protein [Escherichia coli]EIH4880540.1 phage antirepressor KilAC domain-containing protein [Escherichia coli]MCX2081826.1 phage antirepressor KilAC domain-containing protein [Escherichia coli]SQZ53019.1 putative antirepression [Escherichia coli]SRY86709.1 putative antirepression [Escherichia coli]HAH6427097.1 phage antirepressor Ant [Escherichia coli]
MRTSLVTREEMIEAIEQHTACINTRDIPGVIANYFMITKQLYRRKDKHAVHRILLTDIREYLLEQGHLNYATVAAEARKEAHRMKATNVKSEKIFQESELVVVQNQPDEIPVLEWQGVRVVTTETLARGYGVDEANIRNNLSRNLDRFEEGKHYFLLTGLKLREFKNRVTGSYSVGKNARSLTLWTERGAARMSKIVDTNEAWAFFEKLEDSYFRQKEQQPVAIPQTLPEALRLAAELAEQKQLLEQKAHQLNQQLVAAAPKVDFADRVSVAKGILIGNFAKVVGLKQNALFAWLRENGILIASGGRKNVPFQQYINAGYFTVKEVVLDDEDGYQIRLTPQLTGKGQQWLTRKLLDAGLLKPVAAE